MLAKQLVEVFRRQSDPDDVQPVTNCDCGGSTDNEIGSYIHDPFFTLSSSLQYDVAIFVW